MRLGSETLKQRSRQSRLSNTGFAAEQHYLPFTVQDFLPAPQQQIEFFLPTNEVG